MRHALHIVEVARAGIGAVDQAAAVGEAEDGEVGAHHALVVEEVGVDALADIAVTADLRGAEPFQELDMVRTFDVDHVEVAQVDDAAILAHRQMFGIRDAPEVAVVPFVCADRNAITIFLQQVLVGGVAMRTLPAAEFHEVAAELDFALIHRRALGAATGCIGFAGVNRGEIDLLGGLVAAAGDEVFGQLVRIETGVIDRIVVDLGATVGHPVGDQLAITRAVLDPDGDAVPEAAHLLAFAAGRAAGSGDLQEAVERMALVIAEFAEDRGELHGALERLDDLLHVEVALRGREARLVLFEELARMAHARIVLLVITPFDLAAFRRLRVAGVAHIGGVALVAEQRIADVLAGAFELVIGAEEGERMVDRHDRQILTDHFGNQAAPETGADHDVIGHDRAAMGDDALDATTLDDEGLGRRIGKGLELAGLFRRIDKLAGNGLGARNERGRHPGRTCHP